MRIIIKLKEVRMSKNITLSKLAKMTHMSKGHLSRLENQETEPKIGTLVKLAFALHVQVDQLYKIEK